MMKNNILLFLSLSLTIQVFALEDEHNGFEDPRKKVHVCMMHFDKFSDLQYKKLPTGPVVSLFKHWDELKSRQHSVIEEGDLKFYLNHMPRLDPDNEEDEKGIRFSLFLFKKDKKFKTNPGTILLNFDYDHLFDNRLSGFPKEYDNDRIWPVLGLITESYASKSQCSDETIFLLDVVDEDLSEAKALESCKSDIKKLCLEE